MTTFASFIDLTYYLESGMLTFQAPWHPKVSIKELGSIETVGRETRELRLGTHTGTHIDAPRHFVDEGTTIDRIPLERLVGNVSIIDLSYLAENEALTLKMLEGKHITPKVILKFGWGKHWGTEKYYAGYPYISFEAAEYLVRMGVQFIGMDTPSPDDSRIILGSEEDSLIHKYFLRNNVILAEYLAGLDDLSDYDGWKIAALPLKIKGGDGAPARICLFK